MPTVRFTSALQRFFPDLSSFNSEAQDLNEILRTINSKWPGIKDYLVDEQGHLRKHVNIFVDGKLITDREQLSDTVPVNGEVYFFQALSGG